MEAKMMTYSLKSNKVFQNTCVFLLKVFDVEVPTETVGTSFM